MATHTFQIVVTQSGAQATAAAIGQVGAAAQKSASALAFFRQALVVASTVRAAAGFVDLIDAATRIDNRLRVATNSSQEFARAQQFVAQISRSTRTELESNAVTYGRLLKSTESLGLSSGYLEKVMTGLALSVKVGGATSMEARNAMIQFSQSLASGALRGDELRSVSEQLPALATAIGREFGVSGGQLIAFAKANPGILETERVIKAVAAAVPELTEQAKKMTPTITEGFIAIHSAVVTMLGDINRGTGIFGAFSRGLVFIGDNLNVAIELLVVFLALRYQTTLIAWGGATTAFIGNLGAMFSLMGQGNGIMASFNAMFQLNPFTLWIAAIAAAVIALTALYNYFPQVKAAVDGFFGSMAKIVDVLYQIVASIGQTLPSWVTMDGTMKIVANTVALLIAAFGNIITFAMVPFVLAAEGVVRALNALGLASNQSVAAVANARAELFSYAQGLLQGKQATVDAGQATETLKQSTVNLLSPLLGAKGGTDALKASQAALAAEVKKVDEGYRMVGERLTNTIASMPSSIDGFNNLARVTKDWEGYTKAAGTAVTETATASTAAKAPTDSLAGSMKGVNLQASGAAKASQVMATSLASSAESSTTAAKQVKEFADIMVSLNPLMTAAKAAGEAAAQGFNAAGSAANGAAPGIRNLASAYRELASAKAAAGGGSGSSTGTAPIEARAMGGPVLSGSTYLVGERGPELFTPGATGNIIPNHALQSDGATAANDNVMLIVKAINRMANAVVSINKVAAASNAQVVEEIAVQVKNNGMGLKRSAVNYTDTTTSFSGTGFASPGAYTDPFAIDDSMKMQNQFLVLGAQFLVEKARLADAADAKERQLRWQVDNKILPGDEGYMADNQMVSAYTSKGFSGTFTDMMKPFAEEIANLQNAWVYGKAATIGADDEVAMLLAKQEAAIAMLKEQRDTQANYDQFRNWLKDADNVKSSITDFQTATPLQGGAMYGMGDPYGLGKAHRPSDSAKAAMSGEGSAGPKEDRVQVSMVVNTPNAESFRQNRAQIESQLASMVDRANRRAGRR